MTTIIFLFFIGTDSFLPASWDLPVISNPSSQVYPSVHLFFLSTGQLATHLFNRQYVFNPINLLAVTNILLLQHCSFVYTCSNQSKSLLSSSISYRKLMSLYSIILLPKDSFWWRCPSIFVQCARPIIVHFSQPSSRPWLSKANRYETFVCDQFLTG